MRRVGVPLALAALLLLAGGCGGAGTHTAPGQLPVDGSGSPAYAVPAGDKELIRRAVDAVNATAGHGPAAQRAVLLQVVDPSRAGDQRGCRPASTTLHLEPAWPDLRPAPGGGAGTYVLPARIRVYTEDRITGTDVIALIVSVSDGRAHLPPLCIS